MRRGGTGLLSSLVMSLGGMERVAGARAAPSMPTAATAISLAAPFARPHARPAATAALASTSGRGADWRVDLDRRSRSLHSRSVPCAAQPASAGAAWPALAHPTPLLSLAPGEVHLWWSDASDPALTPELLAHYATHFLTPAEADAAGGEKGRILARALVRGTLARYSGGGGRPTSPTAACDPRSLTFTTATRGGKPALHPACNPLGLEFNLTHAGGLAGLAVGRAGSRPGLDLEAAGRTPRAGAASVAGRHFSAQETAVIQAIEASHGPEAANAEFVRLWTLKEAFVKATGDGIRGAGVAVAGTTPAADPATPAAVTQGLSSFTVALGEDGDRGAAKALEAALPGLPLVGGRGKVGGGDPTLTGPAGAVRRIRLSGCAGDAAWRLLLLRPRPGYVAALCVRKEEGRGDAAAPPPLRVRAWAGLPGGPAAPLPTGAAGLACSL